eukprot:gene12147-biopygen5175
MFRLCSDYAPTMLRLCSDYVPTMLRPCSDYPNAALQAAQPTQPPGPAHAIQATGAAVGNRANSAALAAAGARRPVVMAHLHVEMCPISPVRDFISIYRSLAVAVGPIEIWRSRL